MDEEFEKTFIKEILKMRCDNPYNDEICRACDAILRFRLGKDKFDELLISNCDHRGSWVKNDDVKDETWTSYCERCGKFWKGLKIIRDGWEK